MKIISKGLWPVLAIILCVTLIHSPTQAMTQTRENNKAAVGLLCGGVALAALGLGYVYYYRDYYWPSMGAQQKTAEKSKPSSLLQAVKEYDCEKVRSNLLQDADPNERDKNGNPLLFMVVNMRKKRMVADFLEFGADPAIPHLQTGTILQTIVGYRGMSDREKCEFMQAVLNGRDAYLKKEKKWNEDQRFSELQSLIHVVNHEQKPLEDMVVFEASTHDANFTKNLIKILKLAPTYQCFGYFIGNIVDNIRCDLEKTPGQAVERFRKNN